MTDTSLSADKGQPVQILDYQKETIIPKRAVPDQIAIGPRLSIMMFLQYAVWGIWMSYIASYLGSPVAQGGLGFAPSQIGWILGLAGAIGAVSAPFIAGQVADRYLNAERALAILLIVGGAINIALSYTHEYNTFLLLSIAYSVVYMPTLSLTNSIAFQNLDDAEKKFPPIRLWGTIGWIVASVAFTTLWLSYDGHVDWVRKASHLGMYYRIITEPQVNTMAIHDAEALDKVVNTRRIADALFVSGLLSWAYAIYALAALPKTPPKTNVAHPLAFAEAFGLFRKPAFLIVTLVALPIAMIHQVYFIRASPFFESVAKVPTKYLGPVMGIGQASEIFFLLILGFFLKRLGYKWVLVLGCAAYASRFGIFAIGAPPALMIGAQVLHGLCYGCFFAGSFLLVEKLAGDDYRHSAQTVFGIIILGAGPVLGSVYNDKVLGRFDAATTNYHGVWAVQAGIAAVCMLVLLVAFPSKAGVEKQAE